MEKKNYKLIGLQIEGFRKIRAALLKFKDKGITEIIGKNDQGKSTVIDAIEILLKGFRKAEKGMTTNGMDKTRIIGTVGDWTIKRMISEKTNRLEVINKEGLSPKKPQDFLDTLINELTFNPQPFLEKNPNDKLKFIMGLMEIDFTQENAKIETKEEERLQVGRDIKSKGEFKEPEKVDPVDTADLTKQLKDITQDNITEREKQDIVNTMQEKFSSFQAAFEKLSDQDNKEETVLSFLEKLPDKNEFLKKMGKVMKSFDGFIESLPLPDYKDTEGLDKKLASASETNQKATNYTNYVNWKAEKEKLVKKQEGLKKEIEKLRNEKLLKLEKIEMPVDGLKITEEGLFYNDIFCENWARSLGWKIALSLCEKMQPDLRAIFLDNGESLDSDTRKELDQWAKDHDVQVILTVVDSIPDQIDKDTFYIEEGGIFSSEGECVPSPEDNQDPEKEEEPTPPQDIPDVQQKEDHSNYETPGMFNFDFDTDEPKPE